MLVEHRDQQRRHQSKDAHERAARERLERIDGGTGTDTECTPARTNPHADAERATRELAPQARTARAQRCENSAAHKDDGQRSGLKNVKCHGSFEASHSITRGRSAFERRTGTAPAASSVTTMASPSSRKAGHFLPPQQRSRVTGVNGKQAGSLMAEV
jgi:hypothetical protein